MKFYLVGLPDDLPKNKTRYIAVKVKDLRLAVKVDNSLSRAISESKEVYVVEDED